MDKVTTKHSTENLHLEEKPVTNKATDAVKAVEKHTGNKWSCKCSECC